jgi:cytochrome c-type biogenesis protein CcmH/NrfG
MTEGHSDFEGQRDQALRDLVEVDRQLSDGELSEQDAEVLRARYEGEALMALRRLTSLDTTSAATARARRPRLQPRLALYVLGLALAATAAILVPGYVSDRPAGGLVTGNEAMAQPGVSAAAAPEDRLASVTDAQLEAVIAQNPNVVGMRLALAERYANNGRTGLAVVHYTKVLKQEPENPEALAHLGWVMLRLNRPEDAASLVDRALRSEPRLADGLWFQANVRLYGLDDPAGAISSLDLLDARPGISAAVRRQSASLRAESERRVKQGR